MNPFVLVFFSHIFHANHGNCAAPLPFWEWKGTCVKCGKLKTAPRGIFCHNFGVSRGACLPCQNVWCGECFTDHPEISFHINRPENDEGLTWGRAVDLSSFKYGREGDWLMFPFQCEVCWFFNLKNKSPDQHSDDDLWLLGYLRRVNLDGFWSSRPKTVAGNWSNMMKTICHMKDLNIPVILSPIEP